jgi:hypothetical protein
MRLLSASLAYLLFLQTLPAQVESAGRLNIAVIEGEGAINNVRQRTARAPIVQVEDENHKPVAGAVVVFTLGGRAGGVFPNGTNTLTVITDETGRAAANGLRPTLPGRMDIHVNASYRGQVGSTTITQTNVMGAAAAAGAAAHAGLAAKWIVLMVAAAGAAAATGAVVATRGGGGASTAAGTTITPGSGTVGAPR